MNKQILRTGYRYDSFILRDYLENLPYFEYKAMLHEIRKACNHKHRNTLHRWMNENKRINFEDKDKIIAILGKNIWKYE